MHCSILCKHSQSNLSSVIQISLPVTAAAVRLEEAAPAVNLSFPFNHTRHCDSLHSPITLVSLCIAYNPRRRAKIKSILLLDKLVSHLVNVYEQGTRGNIAYNPVSERWVKVISFHSHVLTLIARVRVLTLMNNTLIN